MASFFIIGEKKTRPGVYLRYENWGKPPVAGVDDGKCAAVFRSNWGPLGQALVLEQYEDSTRSAPYCPVSSSWPSRRGSAPCRKAIRLINIGLVPEVYGLTVTFSIMAFPEQITTTPDPIQGRSGTLSAMMCAANVPVYQVTA